jgi:hypothetical protein
LRLVRIATLSALMPVLALGLSAGSAAAGSRPTAAQYEATLKDLDEEIHYLEDTLPSTAVGDAIRGIVTTELSEGLTLCQKVPAEVAQRLSRDPLQEQIDLLKLDVNRWKAVYSDYKSRYPAQAKQFVQARKCPGSCTFQVKFSPGSKGSRGAQTPAPHARKTKARRLTVRAAAALEASPAVTVRCRWLKSKGTMVCLATIGSRQHWFELHDRGAASMPSGNPTGLTFDSGPPLTLNGHWISRTGVQCDYTVDALTCGSLFTRHGFAVSAQGRYTVF